MSVCSEAEDSRVAPTKKTVFARPATGLVRKYSTLDTFFIGISTLGIGTSLIQIGTWVPYAYPGADIPLLMFLGLLLSMFIGLNWVVLSVAMPRSGGDYIFVSRVLGPRLGFLSSWAVVTQQFVFAAADASFFVTTMLASTFFALGLSGVSGMIRVANWLGTHDGAFTIGVLCFVIYFLVTFVGGRTYRLVTVVLMTAAFLSLFLLVGIYLGASPSGFQSAFSSAVASNSTSYQGIIDTAQKGGFALPPFSLVATLSALPYATLAYAGFERGSYIAGEVKSVDRAMPIGIMLTLLVGGLFLIVVPYITFGVMGSNFYQSLNWLYYNNRAAYPLPVRPSFDGLALLLVKNPYLVALFGFSFATWGIINNIARFQIVSRSVMSWGFDRVAPTFFADVNDRFHTPITGLWLYLIGGFLALGLWNYTPYLSLFLSFLGITYILRALPMISAMLLPYKRRELWQNLPIKKMFGAVPLIVISGAIGALIFLYESFQVYAELVTGPFSYLIEAAVVVLIFFVIVGIGIYEVSRILRKREGIDLSLAFKELPPE